MSLPLGSINDLKRLGKYCNGSIKADTTLGLLFISSDDNYVWSVKSLDGVGFEDLHANMFYVLCGSSVAALLFRGRSDNGTFRLVHFNPPLRGVPVLARKRKSSRRRLQTKRSKAEIAKLRENREV